MTSYDITFNTEGYDISSDALEEIMERIKFATWLGVTSEDELPTNVRIWVEVQLATELDASEMQRGVPLRGVHSGTLYGGNDRDLIRYGTVCCTWDEESVSIICRDHYGKFEHYM